MQERVRPTGQCERCKQDMIKKCQKKYCNKCRKAVDKEISAKTVQKNREARLSKQADKL